MDREDDLSRQIEPLRERLSRLSEAGLRINESLDFDTMLQEVLDSARALTQARYGVITLLDEFPWVFWPSGTPCSDDLIWRSNHKCRGTGSKPRGLTPAFLGCCGLFRYCLARTFAVSNSLNAHDSSASRGVVSPLGIR